MTNMLKKKAKKDDQNLKLYFKQKLFQKAQNKQTNKTHTKKKAHTFSSARICSSPDIPAITIFVSSNSCNKLNNSEQEQQQQNLQPNKIL